MATTPQDKNPAEATLDTKPDSIVALPGTESEEQKEAKEMEARYVSTYPPNAPGCGD